MTESQPSRELEPPDGSEPAPGAFHVLGELTTLLLAADTVDDVLRRVLTATRLMIPGADLASITVRDGDGDLRTPVETEPEALELDRLQYRTGQGPCVDAADPAGPAYALSTDLANEDAWPAFAAAARAHGYAAVLSTALLSGPEATAFTGALNIYFRDPGNLDTDARDLAFILATHASLALVTARIKGDLADARAETAELRKAIDTRTLIGQATGILMARRNLTADEAFEVLKRTSQNRNIKLNRLAALLTEQPPIADRI
jgi:hypothetical protein